MSLERPRSNKLLLLGRGVDEIYAGDGKTVIDYRMSTATQARADAVGRYWSLNRHLFTAKGAKIVASGGYARLAGGQAPPPENQREGSKVVDYLVEQGVPSHLLHKEVESGSTTDNLVEVLRAGFFDGEEFSSENPLLLAASEEHGVHRGVPLAQASFGIKYQGGTQVLIGEKEGPKNRVQEFIGGIITEQVINEIDPRAFSVEDMIKVGREFEAILGSKAKMLGAVAGNLGVTGFQYESQRVDLITV